MALYATKNANSKELFFFFFLIIGCVISYVLKEYGTNKELETK